MPSDSRIFYEHSAVQHLLALELAALEPILGGVYGNFGLFLRAHEIAPATLPPHLLGTIIDLALDSPQTCGGRLRCAPAELPIASESCKLVIAQHVLERVTDPGACAAEFARILAPEGVALVFGFNPLSLWRPWVAGKAHGAELALRPRSSRSWQLSFANHGIETLQTRFLGAWSPWQRSFSGMVAAGERRSFLDRLGGSWLLLARKRRSAMTLRLRPASRERAMNPRLAPGAHRQCA